MKRRVRNPTLIYHFEAYAALLWRLPELLPFLLAHHAFLASASRCRASALILRRRRLLRFAAGAGVEGTGRVMPSSAAIA